jgi:hypothetical protein
MTTWRKFIDSKTPEELQEYREQRREHMKNYRIHNQERLRAADRDRYETRKEKEKEKREEKHTCEICGGRYTTHTKPQHLSTKKHCKALEEQGSNETIEKTKKKKKQDDIDVYAIVASSSM